MLHKLIGRAYGLIGRLVLRRKCYMIVCPQCETTNETYSPYHGAFFWEPEYWKPFVPHSCCGNPMRIERSFDAIPGALYRLPGYKAYDIANLVRMMSQVNQSAQ